MSQQITLEQALAKLAFTPSLGTIKPLKPKLQKITSISTIQHSQTILTKPKVKRKRRRRMKKTLTMPKVIGWQGRGSLLLKKQGTSNYKKMFRQMMDVTRPNTNLASTRRMVDARPVTTLQRKRKSKNISFRRGTQRPGTTKHKIRKDYAFKLSDLNFGGMQPKAIQSFFKTVQQTRGVSRASQRIMSRAIKSRQSKRSRHGSTLTMQINVNHLKALISKIPENLLAINQQLEQQSINRQMQRLFAEFPTFPIQQVVDSGIEAECVVPFLDVKYQREFKQSYFLEMLKQQFAKPDEEMMRKYHKFLLLKRDVFQALRKNDLKRIIHTLLETLVFAKENNDYIMMMETFRLLGRTYLQGKLLLEALFFYNELVSFYPINTQHSQKNLSKILWQMNYKFIALRWMGKCFMMLHMHHEAKLHLKKALQYAWYQQNIDYELQIFDDLGMLYYYQADINSAFYFHYRSMRAITELQKMPIVYNSSEDIDKIRRRVKDTRNHYFERNKETNTLIQMKLSTPFDDLSQNIQDFLPHQAGKGFQINRKRLSQKICRDEELKPIYMILTPRTRQDIILKERDDKAAALLNKQQKGSCKERTILNIQIKKNKEKSQLLQGAFFLQTSRSKKGETFKIKRIQHDQSHFDKQEKRLRLQKESFDVPLRKKQHMSHMSKGVFMDISHLKKGTNGKGGLMIAGKKIKRRQATVVLPYDFNTNTKLKEYRTFFNKCAISQLIKFGEVYYLNEEEQAAGQNKKKKGRKGIKKRRQSLQR